MKKFNRLKIVLLALLLSTSIINEAQIKMQSNGNVLVGLHYNQPSFLEFDVRGQMFVSHVPRIGVPGWNYAGCWFQNYSYTHMGSTVYRPIFEPQHGNNYWIGNAAKPFWRVYANEMYAHAFNIISDERVKENFQPIDNALKRVLTLKPYYFDYKYTPTENDDETMRSEISSSYKNHVGFKAQDLLKDFPKLVKYDATADRYSVDYIGLVPELVAAIKEQNAEINYLKSELFRIQNTCCQSNEFGPSNPNIENNGNPNDISTLSQNEPNPFSEETKIKYYIAPQVKEAYIFIYNMNGVQMDKYALTNKGENTLVLSKNKLSAGMYFYTLITDNREIDTKRMILTE